MERQGLPRDAITYSAAISALAKGKQWHAAMLIFDHMQARPEEGACSWAPGWTALWDERQLSCPSSAWDLLGIEASMGRRASFAPICRPATLRRTW